MTDPTRYDLHIHSDFSDSTASISDIVQEAHRRRLHTIAIVDHFWPSVGSKKAGENYIQKRRNLIEDLRKEYSFRILEAAEVDIQSNGSLAPVAGGLEQFDLVIGSFHFSCDSTLWASIMERVVAKRQFNILGHWDGYLSRFRQEDGIRVAKGLAENNITVEISVRYETSFPRFYEIARDEGCFFSLGSDAHSLKSIGRLDEQISLVKALDLPLLQI
ncbi:MAG: PHP domain-containing protein [Candidatus Thorarchaeota archaeon]